MKLKIKLHQLCICLTILILLNCSGDPAQVQKNPEVSVDIPQQQQKSLSEIKKQLEDVAVNISNPIELAEIFKANNISFTPDHLLKVDIEHYLTNDEQAIALGAFGVDLCYINYYSASTYMIDYLLKVRKLSKDLYVDHFFKYDLLKELAMGSLTQRGLDSIQFISTYNMNQIERHLVESKRGHIGALMCLGAWTEGIYLLTQMQTNIPGKVLYDRIGEQKVYLTELMKLIGIFEGHKSLQGISSALSGLKTAFDEVEIQIKKTGPAITRLTMSGDTVCEPDDESFTIISSQQVDKICSLVKELRFNILKINKKG